MKDQYVGDIGDFGKYSLLRAFINAGIKVGINWYLTDNDGSNDGKFTEYLKKDEFRRYDPTVFDALKEIAFNSKASGDHGVDILAENMDTSYAIQCKYYSGAVGNSAVQEAFSGKAYYDRDIAVVMTNSVFTQQAIDEASKLKVKLWDGNRLRSMQ